ncbi:MAG: exodeoxyribonuclease III [Alphaproteobacteria bacterium]|nr:exodeoxyribonuclease III [Alphaproteobacteria bacterium]
MQKIISWNVASLRARMPALKRLLAEERPDIVCLQEVKATDETFPAFELRLAGYHAALAGQKSYNGVAILSRAPLADIVAPLPTFAEDAEARFIQAALPGGEIVMSAYIPNGNPPERDPADTARLAYKLKWMDALTRHAEGLLRAGKKVILCGDFNVIARDADVYNPKAFEGNALMLPPVREAFARLAALPLTNALRALHPDERLYSFWDFQMGAWPRDLGILLDYIFVARGMEPAECRVLKDVRGWDKTSDHAPVLLVLK